MKISILAVIILVFLPLSFLASCGEVEWPEGLPHGEVILPNIEDPDTPGAYFDFSEGEIVYGEEGRQRGDIYLDRTFIAGNPALGVELHDAQPDSLLYDTVAPSWGTRLWKTPSGDVPAMVPIYDGHNIWVKTGEAHTAKLRIMMPEANADNTSYLRLKFEWAYQPDGSNELKGIPGAGEGSGLGESD